MKKIIHRTFALMLACMLFATMALSVSATEWNPTDDGMPIEFEDGPDAGYVIGARISGLPFTMYAQHVTSFLSSQAAGKGFVPKDYTGFGATVWVDGNLTHSEGGIMKTGICYYSASIGKYLPGGNAAAQVSSGVDFPPIYESISNLLQGTTYYGYIRNDAGCGYVCDGSTTVSVAYG